MECGEEFKQEDHSIIFSPTLRNLAISRDNTHARSVSASVCVAALGVCRAGGRPAAAGGGPSACPKATASSSARGGRCQPKGRHRPPWQACPAPHPQFSADGNLRFARIDLLPLPLFGLACSSPSLLPPLPSLPLGVGPLLPPATSPGSGPLRRKMR